MKKEQVDYPLKDFYSKIYKRYDLVNRIFTFSQDKRWRRITAKECLTDKPDKVLDLCCGTGDLAIEIARQSNNHIELTGCDFNKDMLRLAEKKTAQKQIKIEFVQGDAANLSFKDNTFHSIGIAFGFRNLTYNNSNEKKHLEEMYRVLQPGGKLVIVESGPPQTKFVYFFYKLFLKVILVPLGGFLSGNFAAYKYLAKSSEKYYTQKQIEEILNNVGFGKFSIRQFFLGATYIISVQK